MTAKTDGDVIDMLRAIARIAMPDELNLGNDVNPNRAMALGAIAAIALEGIAGRLAPGIGPGKRK